jgi:hypothetical protein
MTAEQIKDAMSLLVYSGQSFTHVPQHSLKQFAEELSGLARKRAQQVAALNVLEEVLTPEAYVAAQEMLIELPPETPQEALALEIRRLSLLASDNEDKISKLEKTIVDLNLKLMLYQRKAGEI